MREARDACEVGSLSSDVYDTWDVEKPLNATDGIPSRDASAAAPIVPENLVASPRLYPTFGPLITKSGLEPNNLGASVWMPYLTESTG